MTGRQGIRVFWTLLAGALLSSSLVARADDFHDRLMKATTLIQGPARMPNKVVRGTCFVLRMQVSEKSLGRSVLITAKHVLTDIAGDTAYVTLRVRTSSGGFSPFLYPISIRQRGRPCWTGHPDSTIDVAALYLTAPDSTCLSDLVVGWLATEAELEKLELSAGDEVFTLGYPRGAASPSGAFPILRSGHLASYPLLPTSTTRRFLLDVPVYPGNSGGPVYMAGYGRSFADSTSVTLSTHCIIGLLSSQTVFAEKESLELATVMPSPFVHQVIARMTTSAGDQR